MAESSVLSAIQNQIDELSKLVKQDQYMETRITKNKGYFEQILRVLTGKTVEQDQNSPKTGSLLAAIEGTNDGCQVFDKMSSITSTQYLESGSDREWTEEQKLEWMITLDASGFISIMQHARNRALREEVYRPYIKRASSDDLDNTPIINHILKLRLEMAKLLNYNNYAEVLFEIDIEPADGLAPVWNNDERFYCVKNSSGSPIAYFYFVPYSRPSEKRGGSWMDEVVSRSRVLSRNGTTSRLPIAHMVCNQTPPFGDKPSLMTFREVETVFHEFGHALQHMLTKQDEGESLPEEVYLKLLAERTFCVGSLSLRQIKIASLDLELHTKYIPDGSEYVYDVDQRVSRKTQVIPPLSEDRFLCAFNNIFAGGYGVGYYSYKWAEVLSADVFSAFEDVGLKDNKAVKEADHKFRETILALADIRYVVANVLTDATSVLGGDATLQILYVKLLEAISCCGNEQSEWHTAEAALFCIRAISSYVSIVETNVMPHVMDLLPKLLHQPQLLPTVCLIIGAFSKWLDAASNGFSKLPLVIDILISWVRNSEDSAAAAALAFRHSVMIAGSVEDSLHLVETLSMVITELPPEPAKAALEELYASFVTPLQAVINQAVVDSVHRLWPIFKAIFDLRVWDMRTMESLCHACKYVVRTSRRFMGTTIGAMLEEIQGMYQQHHQLCFLYLSSEVIKIFGSDPSCASYLKNMTEVLFKHTASLLTSIKEFTTRPDIAYDYFLLASRCIRYCPQLFVPSVVFLARALPRKDRGIKTEDIIYLKFQSYHQTSIALRKGLKLAARFYGSIMLDKRREHEHNQIQWMKLGLENVTVVNYIVLPAQFSDFDPWGKVSFRGEGIVTIRGETIRIGARELRKLEKGLEIWNWD
ncbi:putative cytosolic oligopeptidase A [Hibiscus syriacus]|uniref:Cytosolic oligopeptidase A n=1 Tax=Hibiscus syriacus TaxID=106335 RepID=A0A6A3A6S7_HIBSY|nr:putative cytosolic oligopeptidase A [Hibiscus syriacus]